MQCISGNAARLRNLTTRLPAAEAQLQNEVAVTSDSNAFGASCGSGNGGGACIVTALTAPVHVSSSEVY
jgi:hypothetical protein